VIWRSGVYWEERGDLDCNGSTPGRGFASSWLGGFCSVQSAVDELEGVEQELRLGWN